MADATEIVNHPKAHPTIARQLRGSKYPTVRLFRGLSSVQCPGVADSGATAATILRCATARMSEAAKPKATEPRFPLERVSSAKEILAWHDEHVRSKGKTALLGFAPKSAAAAVAGPADWSIFEDLAWALGPNENF